MEFKFDPKLLFYYIIASCGLRVAGCELWGKMTWSAGIVHRALEEFRIPTSLGQTDLAEIIPCTILI